MSSLSQFINEPLFGWLAKKKDLLIPADTRKTGIFLLGAPGSGKTMTTSREVMVPNLKAGIRQVIFDPLGALTDDFLFTVFTMVNQLQQSGAITADQGKLIWEQIRVFDMGGRNGRVSKWPLFYRLPGDSYSDASARLIDLFGLLDPALHIAPLHGMNALVRTKAIGIVLTALGCGVTEAQEMLTLSKQAFLKQWGPRLEALKVENSAIEVHQAIDFLLNHYVHLTTLEKERLTSSFLAKLSMFDDASMQAMYGATEPSIDWQEVVDRGQTVLLDFRSEPNPMKRRFKMLHTYYSLRDFIIRRGVHERDKPLALIIDELPELFAFDLQGQTKVFAAELTKLIDEHARNKNVWLTLLCQHAAQIDETSLKSLLGMGTVAIGRVADYETAKMLSKTFFPIDPYKIKRYSYTYLQDRPTYQYLISDRFRYTPAPQYSLYPTNPVEFTNEEQWEMNARNFMNLGRFQFLVKTSKGEGDKAQALKFVDFSHRVGGIWVNEKIASRVRQMLWKREGQPIDEVLAKIEARRRSPRKPAITPDKLRVTPEEAEEFVPAASAATPPLVKSSAQEVLAIFDKAFEAVQELPRKQWQLP